MAEELKYVDIRTVARYVARGQVSEKDYEKHLKALPDLAAKAVSVSVEQPGEPTAPPEPPAT